MWKLGTLPPALIAFKGHVHPIDPYWHMLGLGYQNNTDIESLKKAAVIHYNGQSKPWLPIGFERLRPFWTKYVNYSSDFVRNCHILESQSAEDHLYSLICTTVNMKGTGFHLKFFWVLRFSSRRQREKKWSRAKRLKLCWWILLCHSLHFCRQSYYYSLYMGLRII